jgi:Bacterial Ig domain
MQSVFQQGLPALLALLCSASASFSAEPILRITSPADGTVVQPGETVTFKVEASEGVKEVIVIAENPIENSQLVTGRPYEFTIRIAARVSLRSYHFTALSFIKPGQPVYSSPSHSKSIGRNAQ